MLNELGRNEIMNTCHLSNYNVRTIRVTMVSALFFGCARILAFLLLQVDNQPGQLLIRL